MVESSTTTAADEAQRMLDIFASVGARALDVTWTNEAGKPRRPRNLRKTLQSLGGPLPPAKNPDWLNSVFIESISIADLARTIPAMLGTAQTERLNLIVRPEGPGVSFIQLDDLTTAGHQIAITPTGGLGFAAELVNLTRAAFLIIETSPGSFQAWLAMQGRQSKEFVRRVKKAAGADTGASGAVRLAGSRNYKPEHAPNYPLVTIRYTQPGRKVTADELEQLGLVAAPEIFAPLPPPRFVRNAKWPIYAKALAGAPLNSEGTGPDRSKADFVWCMTAIDWGFDIGATAAQLMQEDSKARQLLAEPNGERLARAYALLTATKASEAVDRRRPSPRRRIAAHERG